MTRSTRELVDEGAVSSSATNGSRMIGDRSVDDFATHLDRALATRPVIEQAKGAIVSATHCTADEAFTELVSASQNSNIKLSELAVAVVSMASRRPVNGASAEAAYAVVRSCWGDLSAD